MIVALPLLLFKCTLTVPEPFCAIVIELGLTESEHGTGVGVGDGVGDGVGVGVGDDDGVGVGVGDEEGVGVGDEEGVGVGDDEGVGLGDDEGVGVGVAAGSGVGVGSGITLPPGPLRVTDGIHESRKISESRVTSPEPVILTFTDLFSPATTLVKPTDVSTGIRPRQSKVTVRGMVMVTPLSVEKFWVVTVPEPLKSIVTA